MTDLGDIAAELRRSALLGNPRRLCGALNLLEGAKRQAGDGVIIRCPAHDERTPSCSVTRGPDGTVRCRCFSCDWTGDALTLIGVTTGRNRFTETVDEACDMVGVPRPSETQAREWVAPERNGTSGAFSDKDCTTSYPDDAEAFWGILGRVSGCQAACDMLTSRAIDPREVDSMGLARVITDSSTAPRWARYQGEPWLVTGHVLVLPVFDAEGALRSVRAWRVIPGDSPKRLPPGGHKATGLVLANAAGIAMLRSECGPRRVVVVEGEPDFITVATRTDDVVFGILSGAWTEAHAARVPLGSTVVIRTHCDKAGDKYAANLAKTLSGRGHIRRLSAA